MQNAWGSFFLILLRPSDLPVPHLSSASCLTLLDAPDGAGHTFEAGCLYGVAYLLNCGNALGAITAPILFCAFIGIGKAHIWKTGLIFSLRGRLAPILKR